MCAIYKVSRRKIERGVSWPVRQKASEACNLFLLQANSIRPSPLGAIHLGDGHIYFLRYINMFGFRKYWKLGKYFLFHAGSTRPTGLLPDGRFSGIFICDLWQNLSKKKISHRKPMRLVFDANALYWCSSHTDDNNVVFLLLLW